MPLFRPAQLRALQRIAERSLDTDVEIYKRSTTSSAYGDNDTEAFTYSKTVKGWIRAVPEDSVTLGYGQEQVPATHRLFVPLGTDIDSYDKVHIEGREFRVIDTSVESTYKVFLKCMLRRSE